MTSLAASPPKVRLDRALVDRGLAPSREAAQALIMAGRVQVDGRSASKPGERVESAAEVTVRGALHPYVGRGGVKLAGALDAFGIDPAGFTAIDIGASTGGFTDCLLQRGVARVFAVDVGRGQLDWKLRRDPRVVVVERINARYLEPGDLSGLGPGAHLAVVDVSFISLKLILPRVPALLSRQGPAAVVGLVKPQFEVGRGQVGRGGIVREAALRARAISDVASGAMELGLSVRALAPSSLPGAEGNQEYFLHLATGAGGLTLEEIRLHAERIA